MKYKDIPKLTPAPSYCVDVWLKYVLSTLEEYVQESNLQLDPDFQRLHVWTEAQQVSFIEYLLHDGRDPRAITVLLNNPNAQYKCTSNYQDFVLVDGKQRIEAIRKFLNNNLRVFEKHTLNDFEDKNTLLRAITLKFHINNLQSRKEVLTWYLEVNNSGTPHTEEEIDKVHQLLQQEPQL